jgi:hypothetical protein
MRSYSAYFVRTDDANRASTVFGTVDTVPGSEWLMCDLRTSPSPPSDAVLEGGECLAAPRSGELGEVIFLYGDTSADGFVYEHAVGGELVRKLVWFPMLDDDWTAGWICVEGEPEPWEGALFDAERVEQVIEEERERLGEDDPEAEAEIRRVWESRTIVAGRTYPRCDGTATRLVERSHGIDRA